MDGVYKEYLKCVPEEEKEDMEVLLNNGPGDGVFDHLNTYKRVYSDGDKFAFIFMEYRGLLYLVEIWKKEYGVWCKPAESPEGCRNIGLVHHYLCYDKKQIKLYCGVDKQKRFQDCGCFYQKEGLPMMHSGRPF